VYVFGLVLLIGMIAVTTGINGLYVFLSAGLGGFIISGLLSERAMKSCAVLSVAAALVDDGAPLAVTFTLENSSPWFSVFALDVVFMLAKPKFRMVSAPVAGIAQSRLARIAPGGTYAFEAQGDGLPRGRHREVLALQQTTFPFGILEKFKLTPVPASIVVAPRLDALFLEEARLLLRRRLAALDADKEFFSHKAYAPQDGLKDLDWRKSASRSPRDWVVKQYRAPAHAAPLCLDAAWSHAAHAADAVSYERYLSRVRTALKAVDETGRAYIVDFGAGVTLEGYDEALSALAGAPDFASRADGLGLAPHGSRGTVASSARLVVSGEDLAWTQSGAVAARQRG
jgi:hypothetical protein